MLQFQFNTKLTMARCLSKTAVAVAAFNAVRCEAGVLSAKVCGGVLTAKVNEEDVAVMAVAKTGAPMQSENLIKVDWAFSSGASTLRKPAAWTVCCKQLESPRHVRG